MATHRLQILSAVLVFTIIVSYVDGFVLNGKDYHKQMSGSNSSKDTVLSKLNEHQTTIRHFARHGLCKTYTGKRTLYTAMKTKFCDVSLSMIQSAVFDLCRRNNHMLDKWVEELFDIDGNGYISHFEKQLYT